MPPTLPETTFKKPLVRTVAVRDISPPQPALQGPYRWLTTIGERWTITQGNALHDYRLGIKDLKGLLPTRHDVMHGHQRHYFYKYKESDIVKRAWVKHGGPGGFWDVLKKRRNTFAGDEQRAFDEHVPQDYRPGMLYDITKPFFTPPPGHFYHRLPPVYQNAYNRLGPRTYAACVDALEHTEWPASPSDQFTVETTEDGEVTVRPPRPIPISRRPEADTALEIAVEFFAAYPARPARPLKRPSRPIARALAEVREVLGRAPIAPRRGTQAWRAEAELLEFVEEPSPGHYRWSDAYLECVFAKLCALIEKDPSAWEGIRWEVYDKYVASVSLRAVVRYDALRESWSDAAAEWLSVQVPPDSLRGRCASGLRYDELVNERVLAGGVAGGA